MTPTTQPPPTRLFDTTVFVDHLRGQNQIATQFIKQAISGQHPAAFSIVTDAELWFGVKTKEDNRAHRLLLNRLSRLNINLRIARRAGQMRREYRAHSLHLMDALIAATAEYYALPVYTRNANHFNFIANIDVVGYN